MVVLAGDGTVGITGDGTDGTTGVGAEASAGDGTIGDSMILFGVLLSITMLGLIIEVSIIGVFIIVEDVLTTEVSPIMLAEEIVMLQTILDEV